MSLAYTDAELLEQVAIRALSGLTIAELLTRARTEAFEGMVITAMLDDKSDESLFPMLRDGFTAIMEAIDGR